MLFHSTEFGCTFPNCRWQAVEEAGAGGARHTHKQETEHCANFSNAHIQQQCTSLVITNISVKST